MLSIFRLLLNSLAKILIIIELHKLFDTFSAVCGDFVRLFVEILFGRLWNFVRLFAPQHHSQNY